MDWKEATARVVLAGCEPHPEDVALVLGWGGGEVARALAATIREVVVLDPGPPAPDLPPNLRWVVGPLTVPPVVKDLSVVAAHWTYRHLDPAAQKAVVAQVARLLPERGLLVIGDVMWSLPFDMIDEPEQYGDGIRHAPTTAAIEQLVRSEGFLPDLHRFGPGVAVLIALKAAR